jgi:hypothetical protein
MIRIRWVVVTAAATAIVGMTAATNAQTPAASNAIRHVRAVPVKVGRVITPPVLDRVGSFSPIPDGSTGVNVFGIVQSQAGRLVPNAGVIVMRELTSGTVTATTTVNDLAQFSLRGLPPGLYIAELIQAGRVVASTPAFSAVRGDVVQISQTIPVAPATGLVRAARSAASAVISAAASSGVLAISPGLPVSPRR